MAEYIFHFFIVGIPAAAAFGCFHGYRHRALAAWKLRSGPFREAVLYLFVVYLAGLAAMILWPGYYFEWSDGLWGNLVIRNGRESFLSSMNLMPFRMFAHYLHAFTHGHKTYAVQFFLGNILVFIPLGLLLPLLFERFAGRKVALIGFAFSLSCECLQFFLGRHCDVDDVLLNVMGTVLGFWLYLLLRRYFPGIAQSFRCETSD